jgi:hypothetical protein
MSTKICRIRKIMENKIMEKKTLENKTMESRIMENLNNLRISKNPLMDKQQRRKTMNKNIKVNKIHKPPKNQFKRRKANNSPQKSLNSTISPRSPRSHNPRSTISPRSHSPRSTTSPRATKSPNSRPSATPQKASDCTTD